MRMTLLRIALLLPLSSGLVALPARAVFAQAAAPAPAGDADAQARARYAEGQRLTAAGQYREALAAFTAGYALSRRPAFLFNMAECSRKLGDLEQARAYYERYLAEDPRGPLATTARQRLGERATPAPAPVAPAPTPAPAPVVVPTRPAAPAPAPTPTPRPVLAPVAPAPTDPVASAPRADLTATPEPASSPALWQRSGFWIGVGAAVLLTAGSVYLLSRGSDGPCGDASACADLR